ncbi:hypothetical protein SH449x_001938 [Pirellulaceae bacterium SH449]
MASDRFGGNEREESAHAREVQSLEAWISSARDYVVPTDDLRPRVLEAAAMVSDDKLQERRIGYAIISAAIVSACWSVAWYWIGSVSADSIERSASSISQRALEIHDTESVNIHQATVDAYEEWRSRYVKPAATSVTPNRIESNRSGMGVSPTVGL